MTLRFTAVVASQHALHILHAADGEGGEIHSTYRNTMNVRFPGDQLVCLHSGRELIAPFGIAVGRRFHSPAFERIVPGIRVQAADDVLRAPDVGLEVTLGGIPVWEPRARPMSLAPEAAARHAEIPEAILLQHDNPDGLAGLVNGADGTPLLRRARASIGDLTEGFARRDTARLVAGAEPLLGLGPGLTPSGDDFLAGFLGTAMLAWPSAAALLHDAGRQVLHLAESRTTLLSRAFLAHALRGVLAPPVDALAAAMFEDAGQPAVARAARSAASLGHTSGLDTLAGMAFALRSLAQVGP